MSHSTALIEPGPKPPPTRGAPVQLLLIADGRCTAPRAAEMLREATAPAFEITHVVDGAELERVLAHPNFDVVLIEWSRSAASAADVLARVQRHAPRLPVVILAEMQCDAGDSCVRALRAGAQDALIKRETSPQVLARALSFAVERQRALARRTTQLAEAERAREQAEQARQRAAFAAGAVGALIASLDLESTLRTVAEQAVRGPADFCILDLVEEDGSVRREVVAHADPALQPLAERLLAYPLQRDRPHLVSEVLRTREPVFMSQVSHDYLVSVAQSAEHLALLEELDVHSHLAVPLLARGRLLGAMLLVRASGRPPFDTDDLAVAEELAERAALAIDNARLHAEAQDAIAARNSVLRIVAHDLRNPLSAIHMTTELLLDVPPTPEQLAARLQLIRRGTEQKDHLIQDLLDVVRLDAGQLALDRQLTSPGRLVRQAVELSAPLAASRELSLTYDSADDDLPPLEIDAPRILQVLGNLIGNSIKFTPKGGEIHVCATAGGGEVCFTVRDTGVGMSEDEVGHLFRPFWQARRGGREGAGLGLAISKAIVEAHGGRIWAESTPGEGSTFHVALPAAEERRQTD